MAFLLTHVVYERSYYPTWGVQDEHRALSKPRARTRHQRKRSDILQEGEVECLTVADDQGHLRHLPISLSYTVYMYEVRVPIRDWQQSPRSRHPHDHNIRRATLCKWERASENGHTEVKLVPLYGDRSPATALKQGSFNQKIAEATRVRSRRSLSNELRIAARLLTLWRA